MPVICSTSLKYICFVIGIAIASMVFCRFWAALAMCCGLLFVFCSASAIIRAFSSIKSFAFCSMYCLGLGCCWQNLSGSCLSGSCNHLTCKFAFRHSTAYLSAAAIPALSGSVISSTVSVYRAMICTCLAVRLVPSDATA